MGRLRDVRRKLAKRNGKRQYFNKEKSRDMLNCIDEYFENGVATPRMRRGQCQEIETLVSEEALLFAKYLRNERQTLGSKKHKFRPLETSGCLPKPLQIVCF